MNDLLKDMYPRPGDRIKQWVVDERREDKWERETCPKVVVSSHRDNTDAECRNAGAMPWTWLEGHDCCYTCNDLAESLKSREDIAAWLAEKAARPPIEQDRTKFSDEIAEDIAARAHPFYAFTKGNR